MSELEKAADDWQYDYPPQLTPHRACRLAFVEGAFWLLEQLDKSHHAYYVGEMREIRVGIESVIKKARELCGK